MNRAGTARQLTADAAWVLSGQIGSLVITVFGLRVTTNLLQPDSYGVAIIGLGISALVVATAGGPIFHSLNRWYLDLNSPSYVRILKERAMQAWLYVASAWTLFAAALSLSGQVGVAGFLMIVLFGAVIDFTRSTLTTLSALHARQRDVAAYSLLDSFLRTIGSICAAWIFGTPIWYLIGHYCGALAALALMRTFAETNTRSLRLPASSRDHDIVVTSEQRAHVSSFMAPLVPTALLGWIASVGDRFVSASVLDLGSAGAYIAAQSLVSRPALTVSSAVVALFRPRFAREFAAKHATQLLFRAWIGTLAVAFGLIISVCILFPTHLTNLLLGPSFFNAAQLLAPLAVAYCSIGAAQNINTVSLVRGTSRSVLHSEAASAAALIVVGLLLGYRIGATGVAIGAMVAGLLQFVVSLAFLTRTKRTQ